MKKLRKIKNIFIAVLLPATLLLFYNNETNRHFHRLPDGQIVEVAHPFGKNCKNPLNPKESSKREIIILSQIFYAFSSEVTTVDFEFTFTPFILDIEFKQNNLSYQRKITELTGRSPPTFV